MGQVTWRASDDLVARAKDVAAEQGRSLNEYLTAVVDAATDPGLAGDEAARVRERLARAGLLLDVEHPEGPPPAPERVEAARRRAGSGGGLGAALHADRDA